MVSYVVVERTSMRKTRCPPKVPKNWWLHTVKLLDFVYFQQEESIVKSYHKYDTKQLNFNYDFLKTILVLQ
jgi:hypothetical protein